MKIISLFIIILLFGSALNTHAQNRLIVHEDTRVQQLSNLKGSIDRFPFPKKDHGFRILVNTTDNRELAYKTKAQLLSRFPEYAVYMSYQTPFFKLKIGDFIKEEDAENLQKQVSRLTKQAAYIVPDIVILKPDDAGKRMNKDK